jgi:hypothetical protein
VTTYAIGAGRRTHIVGRVHHDFRGRPTSFKTVCGNYAVEKTAGPTGTRPLCKHCEKQQALNDRDLRRAVSGAL